MTAPRYKQDALYELTAAEGRLSSARRSLEATNKRTTATIAEAVIPSLERRVIELRDEASRLPDRPARDFGGVVVQSAKAMATPWGEVPPGDDGLGIPDFLLRSTTTTEE